VAEFHFLRPLWLVLLPVGVWLIWQLLRGRADGGGWRSVVDAQLRPHVLAEPEVLRDSRLALIVALTAWLVATVALAGPTWERLPVPAFRSDEALVVTLDLSRSMNAGDVEPSRLARVKLKLLDLLERRAAGQTALVVFSTHAFTVTPLTTDTRTISALIGAVDTDIMPTQGGRIAAGLERAATLLEQTGLREGDVLVITDSEVTEDDLDAADDLASDGYRVSVLAAGTEQGAPIPRREGGFVTDDSGQVVVPQVDATGLQRLAAAGGGRYAALTTSDRDLDTLFPTTALPRGAAVDAASDESGGEQYEADIWLDRGLLLVLLLLPLLALCFRRGWIAVWLLVVLAPQAPAEAFEWQDLWLRPDQRGQKAFESDQPERAAELFESPEWRGAAQYRAGQFEQSAVSLAAVDSAEGHYNRGNALAYAGQLPAAIAAYERALALDQGHEDARYNRDLLEQYLEDNPEQQQRENQPGQQGDAQQSQSQSGQQQEGEGGDEQQGEQGEQGESGDSEAQAAEGADERDEVGEPQDEEAQDANAGEETADEATAGPAGPEEVEQWASDQAAEQWLRRVPQDPGGLLRRKFLYQYQRLGVDPSGNRVEGVGRGPEQRPW
jgi:Ca-activated chloride channel family protein